MDFKIHISLSEPVNTLRIFPSLCIHDDKQAVNFLKNCNHTYYNLYTEFKKRLLCVPIQHRLHNQEEFMIRFQKWGGKKRKIY